MSSSAERLRLVARWCACRSAAACVLCAAATSEWARLASASASSRACRAVWAAERAASKLPCA
eukprot:scaffold13861_cov79-Isochrysis_galbana.AAC.1